MQIVNKLNKYISAVDPGWINRLKPTSEENLRLLKKYSGMDKENLDFPDAFIEFAKYAGEGDGGLLSETLEGDFSIEALVWENKETYESFPEDINPFNLDFLTDYLGMRYMILLGQQGEVYHGEWDEIDYDETNYMSPSFEYFLFQCAVLKYEGMFYKESIYFGSSPLSFKKSADKRQSDTLESIMQTFVEKYNLKCAWFNNDYFFHAHNKDISIILDKRGAIAGKIMGNDLQQMEEFINPLLDMIGAVIQKKP